MPKTTPQPDPEDAHKDLLATLAASRELGPEMDRALAESYMQKHQAATPAPAPQNQQVTLPSRFNSSDLASAIVMVAGIAAFVTLLIVFGSHAWAFIWIFFIFGGWRWFGWNRRNAEYRARRMEYRQSRREMRDDWRAMRRGYYQMSDPDQPRFPTIAEPSQPQVSAPPKAPAPAPAPVQLSTPPAAAPLPPVAPVAQSPVEPQTPPTTPSAGSAVPPINPAG